MPPLGRQLPSCRALKSSLRPGRKTIGDLREMVSLARQKTALAWILGVLQAKDLRSEQPRTAPAGVPVQALRCGKRRNPQCLRPCRKCCASIHVAGADKSACPRHWTQTRVATSSMIHSDRTTASAPICRFALVLCCHAALTYGSVCLPSQLRSYTVPTGIGSIRITCTCTAIGAYMYGP